MTPRFSICIPCFNHAKYIGKTIQSVLDQDYTDFEIIIADNASTDDSLAVIRSFRDPRIRVLENAYNIGFAPNLQRVTSPALGQYVNLLSSDDVMSPDALSTYSGIIDELDNAEACILMSQCWQIDGQDNVTSFITRQDDDIAPHRVEAPDEATVLNQRLYEVIDGSAVFRRCMETLNTAGVFCSVVYPRALWSSVGGYNSTQLINPDMHFMLKLLRCGPEVVYVNRPLYSYRRHDMGQGAQQSRQGALKMQVDIYKYTIEFDEAWLAGTALTASDQRFVFVNRYCVKDAYMRLKGGYWLDASRRMAFGWATYPLNMATSLSAWTVFVLLALGPIGIVVAWCLWRIHRARIPALRSAAITRASGVITRPSNRVALPSINNASMRRESFK